MKGNELFKWDIHMQGTECFIYKEISYTYKETGFSYKKMSYSYELFIQRN